MIISPRSTRLITVIYIENLKETLPFTASIFEDNLSCANNKIIIEIYKY